MERWIERMLFAPLIRYPSIPHSRGKQIDVDDEGRTALSFSISFDLFLHLKKLWPAVTRIVCESAICFWARDGNACAVGLLTRIDRIGDAVVSTSPGWPHARDSG